MADVDEEFCNRAWHPIVDVRWDGSTLLLVATNDYDDNGGALANEFSDTVAAYALESLMAVGRNSLLRRYRVRAKIRVAAAFFFGTTLSCATSETAGAGEMSSSNGARPVQIPFRLVGSSAPLVNVRIQNRNILLELDIGDSSALVLHPAVLNELSTAPTGESSKGYGMEGKVFDLPIVQVKRVEMGTAQFVDVLIHADSHDDAFRKQQLIERGTSGHIGTGLFKGYKLVLNYRQHYLTLVPNDSPPKSQRICRGQMIPLVRSVNWGLVSSAHTEGGDALFVWDTGAPALAMIKANAPAIHVDVSHDSVFLKHFEMNGHEFGPIQFQVWDFPAPPGMMGMLGYDFFRDHTVCIDLTSDQVFVQ